MDSTGVSIVHFQATVSTEFGQKAVISGEGTEFGSWVVRKGLQMKTSPERYPVWRSERPIMVKKSSRA